MAIDYDKIMNWPFEDVEQSYTEKGAILYALGVGLCNEPSNPDQLKFLYENDANFQVLPTTAIVLDKGEGKGDEMISFRARLVETDAVVLNNGRLTLIAR